MSPVDLSLTQETDQINPSNQEQRETILSTKLFAPSIRPDHVRRSRLIAQINTGLDKTLILISAPAGYGKTTAALGPCIGASCYEVGPEVREGLLRAGFPTSVFTERGHGPKAHVPGRKALLDLRLANVWLLEGIGLAKANILDAGPACTHCEPSLLSYRRDPRDPRRMVNFIGFRKGDHPGSP